MSVCVQCCIRQLQCYRNVHLEWETCTAVVQETPSEREHLELKKILVVIRQTPWARGKALSKRNTGKLWVSDLGFLTPSRDDVLVSVDVMCCEILKQENVTFSAGTWACMGMLFPHEEINKLFVREIRHQTWFCFSGRWDFGCCSSAAPLIKTYIQ